MSREAAVAAGMPRTKSLGRAIELLEAVARRPEGASASALARAAGLPRSTVSRTLRTLEDFGLVQETGAGGGWVLGYQLVRLARAADPHGCLVDVAVRSERALAAMIGISGPTFRLGKSRRNELLPTVQATAAEIERALA